MVPPEQAAIFQDVDRKVLATGAPHESEEMLTSADGSEFWLFTRKSAVAVRGERYVVGVISDITDPSGEGSASHHLYSDDYVQRIKRALTPAGVCAAQAQELSVRDASYHARIRALLGGGFAHLRFGAVYVPSFGYPEGFVYASDDPAALTLPRAVVDARLRGAGVPLRHGRGEVLLHVGHEEGTSGKRATRTRASSSGRPKRANSWSAHDCGGKSRGSSAVVNAGSMPSVARHRVSPGLQGMVAGRSAGSPPLP